MVSSLPDLPPGCQLRPALASDQWALRWLVFKSRLDPTQLRWQQFWVIEHEHHLIACGQLRHFPDAQELGSLMVVKAWRGQGLGKRLTAHLIRQATHPLYLECVGAWRVGFYQQLGFRPVTVAELPLSLQRKFGRSQHIARWLRLPIAFMVYAPHVSDLGIKD